MESFKSQWKGTGLTPGLMSWCSEYLYVSLTWTAGILEICCSLRAKKKSCQAVSKFFFFARSCLGKVPGRAPFSQLSQQATACTIRMQIVKQINKNELDTRKRKNQVGQLISKWINKKEMQWEQGCSQVEGVREDRSQQYRHRRGVIGYIPVTR